MSRIPDNVLDLVFGFYQYSLWVPGQRACRYRDAAVIFPVVRTVLVGTYGVPEIFLHHSEENRRE